jgi:hypothetical protein
LNRASSHGTEAVGALQYSVVRRRCTGIASRRRRVAIDALDADANALTAVEVAIDVRGGKRYTTRLDVVSGNPAKPVGAAPTAWPSVAATVGSVMLCCRAMLLRQQRFGVTRCKSGDAFVAKRCAPASHPSLGAAPSLPSD